VIVKLKAIICTPLLVVACSNESPAPAGSTPQSANAAKQRVAGKSTPLSASQSAADETSAASGVEPADEAHDSDEYSGTGADQARSEAGETQGPDQATIEQIILKDAATNNSPSVLYATIDHLARSGKDEGDLDIVRFGMTKALNSVSTAPKIVPLRAIDPAQTVFRIDLAEFKQARSLGLITSAELAATNVSKLGNATVVKGDWLVFALSRPETYDRLLGLPALGSMLETQLRVDLSKALQINTDKSEVVFNGRVLERMPLEIGGKPGGYYWRSFDFVRDDVMQNAFQDPTILRNTSIPDFVAGEFIYSLPNGMQAYYLTGFGDQHRFDVPAPGKSIDPGVATDFRRAQDGVTQCVGNKPSCGIVINGESCMTCHMEGVRLPAQVVGTNGATMDQMKQLLDQDRARFKQALTEMNFPQVSIEPIYGTLLIFKKDRSFADAREQAGEVEAVLGQ
jgi:hypothetical protein